MPSEVESDKGFLPLCGRLHYSCSRNTSIATLPSPLDTKIFTYTVEYIIMSYILLHTGPGLALKVS